MGTLIRLVPPAPALARALGVDEETAARAFRAEAQYYVAHHLEGRDADSLADLRRRCAAVVADVAGVDGDRALEALLGSLAFEAFEDAAPTLSELRGRGLRLVVVSNWDCSLPRVLGRIGIARLVDAIVASALVGAAKPDRRIFEAALEQAGCAPADAIHVGDSPAADVEGAAALGIRAVLLQREGAPPPGAIGSLAEMTTLLS
jgi:putative hydrolase of the HAD superfamily